MSNDKYCPFCGALQEKGERFCGSCGASIEQQVSDSNENVKIISETPITPPPPPGAPISGQTYTYGAETTYPKPRQTKKSDKAVIALIMGVMSFIIPCFIFPIIGLVLVKQAKDANEDSSTITIASIVNWIFLFLTLIIPTVLLILSFTLGWFFIPY